MAFKTDFEALILGAVAAGPLHGYGIVKAIREGSQGALRAGQGQLYPVLHRMEEAGWLAAEWEPQGSKPPRKVYRLTEEGTAALSERKQSWSVFSRAVDAILKPSRREAQGNA
jgi:DNA-binding PadR family transcriptional regulator